MWVLFLGNAFAFAIAIALHMATNSKTIRSHQFSVGGYRITESPIRQYSNNFWKHFTQTLTNVYCMTFAVAKAQTYFPHYYLSYMRQHNAMDICNAIFFQATMKNELMIVVYLFLFINETALFYFVVMFLGLNLYLFLQKKIFFFFLFLT